MEKQTLTKIISRIIIFVFLLYLILPITPINAAASAGANASLYSNPNQDNSKNPWPYKFKISDVVNSSLLTSVVGCTGVVSKTAKFMSSMVGSPEQRAAQLKATKDKLVKLANNVCATIKAGIELSSGTIIQVNDLTTGADTIIEKQNFCEKIVVAKSDDQIAELQKIKEEAAATTFKEQCFDGIAITLAKNQLTAMARSTMNWVASGYGGNPLFVQNMKNLTYNLEKNVVETGINIMLAPQNANPYAADFSRTTLNNKGILASSTRFLGGLQSDLSNFVTDPQSYYSDAQLTDAQKTQQALQNARNANAAFSRSFSSGGWNAWLALTQREQNNPLGFNMVANQYLSDMQAQVVSETKADIAQNNGFMSQKECIQWQMYNKDSSPKTENVGNVTGTGLMQPTKFVFVKTKPAYQNFNGDNEYGVCADWKIITPGSLIKDKVGNYLNSPDRQAELVKTINDGLNLLFSSLLSKFQSNGIMGLSDSSANTSNWTDNMNSLSSSGSNYDNNGAYDNFNLTRDLGNTYIHEDAVYYGKWDAKNNWTTGVNTINSNKKLYPSLNPELYQTILKKDKDGKEILGETETVPIITNNAYYTVDTAGKTKLINEGYNNWEIGDRAFWDGSVWQNWKKGQQSPIAKRGVIQIQQDYIVAAKEVLGVLPKIMTSLGELDYCLPGPNPSYKTNSTDAQSTYQDWVNSIYTGPMNQTDTDRLEWKIDRENSQTYKKLANIFNDNPNTWKSIVDSNYVSYFLNYFGNFTGTKNAGVLSYAYVGKGKNSGEAKYAEAVKLQKFTTDYTNNYLFQNFYDVFDNVMNKVYFGNMTRQYNDTETSIGVDKNGAYVPMAQNGLDLTKNILYYNDDINTKIQDYTDAVAQAKINIAKLQPIRDEISGIILAAQKRRDDELSKTMGLNYAEYRKKYATCLSEENIQVFDADGIIGRGGIVKENCEDGIDNDLNGLTDINDPACPGYVAPTNTSNTTNTTRRGR